MVIGFNLSIESLRNEFEKKSINKWRMESQLLLLKAKGVDSLQLRLLEFDFYFKTKSGPELAETCQNLIKNIVDPFSNPEIVERLKNLLIILLEFQEMPFTTEFLMEMNPMIIFNIYKGLVSTDNQNCLIFHVIAKNIPEKFYLVFVSVFG